MWIDGIVDLSHWQSPVDFGAMKSSGVLAVILKATQGISFVDPTFSMRAAQAMTSGLLVGAYHFADGSDPEMQAQFFLRVAGGFPVLALDLERNDLGTTVSIQQAAMMVSVIQSATGRVPLCYIGRYGPDGMDTNLPNSILSRCPLWLPEYTSRISPIPPPGWGSPTFWQWTDSGYCPGVSSPCDLTRYASNSDDLKKFWETD